MSAPKMDEVVCARNLFYTTRVKPVLQATVAALRAKFCLLITDLDVRKKLKDLIERAEGRFELIH